MTSDELSRLLLTAPAGVALLQHLEATQRLGRWPFPELPDSDPTAVNAAENAIETLPIGDLLKSSVEAADQIAGPWNPLAWTSLPSAYRFAQQRASIARAIADKTCAEQDVGRGCRHGGAGPGRGALDNPSAQHIEVEQLLRRIVEVKPLVECAVFEEQSARRASGNLDRFINAVDQHNVRCTCVERPGCDRVRTHDIDDYCDTVRNGLGALDVDEPDLHAS